MADLLQTVDLSNNIPAGWTLVGFSAPKSDGVNPYRVVEKSTQIQFTTAAPRYACFQVQLFSPTQDVTATVKLDGQDLGKYHFAAGKFVSVYPGDFVGAGLHHLEIEQSCAQSCEIHQYHLQAQFYTFREVPFRSVGYNVQRWWLNVPDVVLKYTGFSGIQFDGNNFYRTLTTEQPVTITLPVGIQPTTLHYLTQTDHGAYKLTWTADGQALTVRNDLKTEWSPAGQNASQDVLLVGSHLSKQLQVTARCQSGGTECFPIRLFFVEVTGVPQAGLGSLSMPKQAFSIGLCVLFLLLAVWFLRPWKTVTQVQG